MECVAVSNDIPQQPQYYQQQQHHHQPQRMDSGVDMTSKELDVPTASTATLNVQTRNLPESHQTASPTTVSSPEVAPDLIHQLACMATTMLRMFVFRMERHPMYRRHLATPLPSPDPYGISTLSQNTGSFTAANIPASHASSSSSSSSAAGFAPTSNPSSAFITTPTSAHSSSSMRFPPSPESSPPSKIFAPTAAFNKFNTPLQQPSPSTPTTNFFALPPSLVDPKTFHRIYAIVYRAIFYGRIPVHTTTLALLYASRLLDASLHALSTTTSSPFSSTHLPAPPNPEHLILAGLILAESMLVDTALSMRSWSKIASLPSAQFAASLKNWAFVRVKVRCVC
ncbi:hypothetical protein BC829DRAFT_6116 [Chytridium lagenaria]|nr:hypothetical protein BC829DRAFT_6116 [Chytridium lagenaria]